MSRTVALPGGTVVLGLEGDVRATLARCMPAPAFARYDRDGVIDQLANSPVDAGAFFTRRRIVTIPPLVIEVEATSFGELTDDDDDIESILERHCGDNWRLPTPDEWEYIYSAGSRDLFPWGDAWPGSAACPVKPRDFVNAFGLRFSFATECTSEDRILGGGDPDGWNLNGFDGAIVHASAYFMDESHVAHFEWEAYEASGVRRILRGG